MDMQVGSIVRHFFARRHLDIYATRRYIVDIEVHRPVFWHKDTYAAQCRCDFEVSSRRIDSGIAQVDFQATQGGNRRSRFQSSRSTVEPLSAENGRHPEVIAGFSAGRHPPRNQVAGHKCDGFCQG